MACLIRSCTANNYNGYMCRRYARKHWCRDIVLGMVPRSQNYGRYQKETVNLQVLIAVVVEVRVQEKHEIKFELVIVCDEKLKKPKKYPCGCLSLNHAENGFLAQDLLVIKYRSVHLIKDKAYSSLVKSTQNLHKLFNRMNYAILCLYSTSYPHKVLINISQS